jgi:hypothetical protein
VSVRTGPRAVIWIILFFFFFTYSDIQYYSVLSHSHNAPGDNSINFRSYS